LLPETALPFPKEEYQRRVAAVIAAFEDYGVDAVAATNKTSQEYLSGYDGSGSYFAPFPIIVTPGRPPTYIVRKFDEDAVRSCTWIEDIVPYWQERDQPRVWADVLRSHGLERARLGLELGTWNLAPADVSALAELLPGLQIIDVTRLIPRVAAIKSDLEIAAMRSAMEFTDIAVHSFQRGLSEGVSEAELADAVTHAVAQAGGEVRILTLLFGRRTALPHGRPSRYRLSPNSPAYTELGGISNGYVAGLCRSAVLGEHKRAANLHLVAEEMLAAVIDAMHPGAIAGDIDSVARGVLQRAGRSAAFRHRTGYQNGIDWLYRGNISLEPGSVDVLQPKMTFHMACILFEEAEIAVGCSQTVLITSTAAEPLSQTAPTLHLVN
jgi:Xaa-Pro aminopeptidase